MTSRRQFLSLFSRSALLAGTPLYTLATKVLAENHEQRAPGIQESTGEVVINGASTRPGIWPGYSGEVEVDTQSSQVSTLLVGKDAFLLREKSKVVIEQDDNLLIKSIRLISGKLLSVFGSREQSLQVHSSEATLGIRGTGLYMENYPHITYVCTCYGTVEIASQSNANVSETVSTRHHESPRYILDESRGGLIVPAPVFNHSDLELILLESLAGRPSPFPDTGIGGY